MKKKTEKTKPEEPEKAKDRKSSNETPGNPSEEKPFDFGGLPEKDLKKNLGCG